MEKTIRSSGSPLVSAVGLVPSVTAAILVGLSALVSEAFSDGAPNIGALILGLLAVVSFPALTVTLVAIVPFGRSSADVAAILGMLVPLAATFAGLTAPVAAVAACFALAGCLYASMRKGIEADDDAGILDLQTDREVVAALCGMLAAVASVALIVAVPWLRGWHLAALIVVAVWYDRHVFLARRIAARKAGAA